MSEENVDARPLNLKPKTIEDHNRQAEQALAFFLRDFPQTYRLLAGSRFQGLHKARCDTTQ